MSESSQEEEKENSSIELETKKEPNSEPESTIPQPKRKITDYSTDESENEREKEEDDSYDEAEFEMKTSPYHLVGGVCFVAALIVAIGCVLSTALLRRADTDFDILGWVFGATFGGFLFFLFLCLCCTYYLGAPKESWETPPFHGIRKSFSNFVGLAGLILEFIQICSFSFNRTRKFSGLDLSWINYIAVPIGDGADPKVFDIIYWLMFVVAFTPYLFVILVRIVVYIYTVKRGEQAAAKLIERFQDKIHSVLWFLVNALYFPVIGSMIAGSDCTFQEEDITLDADPSVSCLKGQHIAILVCSQLALVIYYPAASFAQAQTHNISDIKFKPRIVFIMLQAKFVLAIIAIFFTTNIIVYYVSALILNITFLLINVIGQPCLVRWVNRVRTVLFSLSLWATICSGIVGEFILDDNENIIPGILLLSGWVFIVLALVIFFPVFRKVQEKRGEV